MSKTKRYISDEVYKSKSKSNRRKFEATIAKDILEQAMADSDAPDSELHEMKFIKERKRKH